MSITDQADVLAVNPIAEEIDERDFTIAPPKADPTAFYGLVSEVAKAATDGREPNKASVALAFICWLSAAAGRHHYIRVGDQHHPLLINGLHVGRSLVGGKGESWSLVKRIQRAVDEMMCGASEPAAAEDGVEVTREQFAGRVHIGGLSTGEGLAALVHDGYTTGKIEKAPINDKRLLVIEAEFARMLELAKREGNTLSAVIRDVWDGGSIQPATKSASIWSTEPHVVVHGGITPTELRARMGATAAQNGLMNRFLMIYAERTQLVALPPPTAEEVVRRLALRVRDVIKYARGDYPQTRYAVEITLSNQAKQMYEVAYPALRRRQGPTEIVNALIERRAPITLRLAALFALTDQTGEVSADHMQAAIAWSRLHAESAAYIFGQDMTQRIEAEQCRERKQKILDGIRPGRWVTRTEIRREIFAKRITSLQLNQALEELLVDGKLLQKEEDKSNGIGSVKRYTVPAHNAHHAQAGAAPGYPPLRTAAHDAHKGKMGERHAHGAQSCATTGSAVGCHVAHDAHDARQTKRDDEVVV